MRYTAFITRLIVFSFLITATTLVAYGQNDRLTLAEILTGLQSKSSGASLATKNSFITQRVNQRGVTFSMSQEIRNELLRAGASVGLMTAIQRNGPRNVVKKRGSASNILFDRLWVSYDVTERGQKGMRVHTKFTIRDLMGEPLQLTVRFQKDDGDILRAKKGSKFRNRGGQLAVFKALRPGSNSALYNDYSVFLPYSELDLPRGVHKLKVDADIIYPDGTLSESTWSFIRFRVHKTSSKAVNEIL